MDDKEKEKIDDKEKEKIDDKEKEKNYNLIIEHWFLRTKDSEGKLILNKLAFFIHEYETDLLGFNNLLLQFLKLKIEILDEAEIQKHTNCTFNYFTYKDNSMYTGYIRDSMPHGRGLLTFKNGG